MPATIRDSSVTFAVDDVAQGTTPLRECRAFEAVKSTLGSEIESCCDYHGSVIDKVHYQPLLAAVYTAFNEHRPLVLSPDAVWITIAQGVAHHMAIEAEWLRSRFVSHQGKLNLVVEVRGWIMGSPENPWPEAFSGWSEQIREHVGHEVHDSLICDFSTSGPVERTASQIVMMDVFERYFHYVLYGICGIPTITLEGTPTDWQRLADKTAALAKFDLDWWLRDLLPICDQFVRSSQGVVNLDHWQSICKLRQEYGGDVINGWIAKLFPYLRAFPNGPCTRRNPVFDTGEGFRTWDAPSGLSRVPFAWIDGETRQQRRMEAIGGLIGIEQDHESLALRPKVGWAVRPSPKMDVLVARLGDEHKTFPPAKSESDQYLPPDLCDFYYQTDGAELSSAEMDCSNRILPRHSITRVDWGPVSEFLRNNDCAQNGHIWYRFVDLADGSWLAINPHPDTDRRYKLADEDAERFSAICHCHQDTHGQPGKNPVIALSFTELLERLVNGGGRPYWLDPCFQGYGDAEDFMRR